MKILVQKPNLNFQSYERDGKQKKSVDIQWEEKKAFPLACSYLQDICYLNLLETLSPNTS